jgi:hypothetical protein
VVGKGGKSLRTNGGRNGIEVQELREAGEFAAVGSVENANGE